MKQLVLFVLSICLFTVSLAQKKEEKKVKESFNNYKEALLEEKGVEAAEMVDSNTITYYEMILDKSLKADSTEVSGLNPIDKLTVLTVRHRVPKDKLIEGMNGKDFFAYSVNNGMIGKNSVKNITIGEVSVEENKAKGQMLTSGHATPIYFGFQNEDGWKIDLTSIFPSTNEAMNQMMASMEITAEEWIFQALEILTGTAPTSDIWDPILED